jgi:hypothetical protein
MKRLLLVALMVLVTLVGMVGFSRAGNEVSALQASANTTNEAVGTLQAPVNAGVPVKPKMYYLTVTGFTGGDAIKACDPRFHMASISEIQDPSNLQYVTSTPAHDYDSPAYDQGLGPPSGRMGWIRLGYFTTDWVSDNRDLCMSSSDQQSGTTMSRRFLWDNPDQEQPASYAQLWWYTTKVSCSQPEPVWCVEDPD